MAFSNQWVEVWKEKDVCIWFHQPQLPVRDDGLLDCIAAKRLCCRIHACPFQPKSLCGTRKGPLRCSKPRHSPLLQLDVAHHPKQDVGRHVGGRLAARAPGSAAIRTDCAPRRHLHFAGGNGMGEGLSWRLPASEDCRRTAAAAACRRTTAAAASPRRAARGRLARSNLAAPTDLLQVSA